MIYLDHNATSPLLAEVREAMEPWLGVPANPASVHRFGQRAAVAVERAREQVAALIGGNPAGVVFTSGATEANHQFLRGLAPRRLALGAIEHPCVRGAAALLETAGTQVHWLPIVSDGRVSLEDLPDVDALSLMVANHETGVIQPVHRALELAAERGFALHLDATQAAGRMCLALGQADAVVLSSHKIGGPGGVGALVLPDGEGCPPLFTGGAQERGRRAGTVNTAGVVGFGAACDLALRELDERAARWRTQIQRLESAVSSAGGRVVGAGAARVPNTVCAVFPGVSGELLVQALDLRGIAASHGAACASGSLEPSPVLLAMGEPDLEGALRLSLGPRTTDEAIDSVVAALAEVLLLLEATAER